MPFPALVAIVNVTPDSFSDGGNSFHPEHALAHVEQVIMDGADMVDIGAESTRPNAVPVSAQEEWERLEPVLLPAIQRWGERVSLSVDTRHAQTAQRAVDAGIRIINDVGAARNEELLRVVASVADCRYILMHSLSVPADKHQVLEPREGADVVESVLEFARNALDECARLGIHRERVMFDPGIGFGKTTEQSWHILHNIRQFRALNVPLYIGHSRKSFLCKTAHDSVAMKDEATLAVSNYLAGEGVEYLRVHAIKRHVDAKKLWERFHV